MKRARTTVALAVLSILVVLALTAPVLRAQALAITSPTEGQMFLPGDVLRIEGKTSSPGQMVAIAVYAPYGRWSTTPIIDQTVSDAKASFSKEVFRFPTEPSPDFPEGVWRIVVREVATGQEVTVRINFTYAAPPPPTPTPPTVTVTEYVTVVRTVTTTVTTTVPGPTVTITTTVPGPTVTVTTTDVRTVTTTVPGPTVTTTTTVPGPTVTQVRTETVTTTSPVTTTVEKAAAGPIAGAAIAALIVGIAIGYVVFRAARRPTAPTATK